MMSNLMNCLVGLFSIALNQFKTALVDLHCLAPHYDIFDPFLCHLNEELEFDDKME